MTDPADRDAAAPDTMPLPVIDAEGAGDAVDELIGERVDRDDREPNSGNGAETLPEVTTGTRRRPAGPGVPQPGPGAAQPGPAGRRNRNGRSGTRRARNGRGTAAVEATAAAGDPDPDRTPAPAPAPAAAEPAAAASAIEADEASSDELAAARTEVSGPPAANGEAQPVREVAVDDLFDAVEPPEPEPPRSRSWRLPVARAATGSAAAGLEDVAPGPITELDLPAWAREDEAANASAGGLVGAPALDRRSARLGTIGAPSRAQVAAARRLQARKVSRLVRHVDLWSLCKVSLIFYLCMLVVGTVAGTIIWSALQRAGAISSVEGFVESVFLVEDFHFEGADMFRIGVLGGLVGVVVLTLLTVLAGLLFNLISDLSGGVRISVVELETARPVPPRRSR